MFYFFTQTKMKNTKHASILFLLSLSGLLVAVLFFGPSYARSQEIAGTGTGTITGSGTIIPDIPSSTNQDNQNLNWNENGNMNGDIIVPESRSFIQNGIIRPPICKPILTGVALTADHTTVRVSEPVTFTATLVWFRCIRPHVDSILQTENTLPKPAISILSPPGAEYYNSLDYGDGNIGYFVPVDVPIQHMYDRPGVYHAFFEYRQPNGHFVSDDIQITVIGGGGGGLLPAQLTAYSDERTNHFPPQIEQLHQAANSREVTFKITNDEGIDPSSIRTQLNDTNIEYTLQKIENGYLVTLMLPTNPTVKEFLIVISATSKNISDSNYKELRVLVTNPSYSPLAELESLKPPELPLVAITPVVPAHVEVKAITYVPTKESKKIVRSQPIKKNFVKKGYSKPVVKKLAIKQEALLQPQQLKTLFHNFFNRLVKHLMSSSLLRMRG